MWTVWTHRLRDTKNSDASEGVFSVNESCLLVSILYWIWCPEVLRTGTDSSAIDLKGRESDSLLAMETRAVFFYAAIRVS